MDAVNLKRRKASEYSISNSLSKLLVKEGSVKIKCDVHFKHIIRMSFVLELTHFLDSLFIMSDGRSNFLRNLHFTVKERRKNRK